jgi:hypothetical protein
MPGTRHDLKIRISYRFLAAPVPAARFFRIPLLHPLVGKWELGIVVIINPFHHLYRVFARRVMVPGLPQAQMFSYHLYDIGRLDERDDFHVSLAFRA